MANQNKTEQDKQKAIIDKILACKETHCLMDTQCQSKKEIEIWDVMTDSDSRTVGGRMMYGYISGFTDANNITFCPKCGAEITDFYSDGTACLLYTSL